MTSHDELVRLIEDLEGAEEGGLALDRRIALALGWREVPSSGQWGTTFITPNGERKHHPPDFSTNLQDARLTVPEDSAWIVGCSIHGPHARVCTTKEVAEPTDRSMVSQFTGAAMTEPLALCAASMRALLEKEETE